jgi:hypothetical protein
MLCAEYMTRHTAEFIYYLPTITRTSKGCSQLNSWTCIRRWRVWPQRCSDWSVPSIHRGWRSRTWRVCQQNTENSTANSVWSWTLLLTHTTEPPYCGFGYMNLVMSPPTQLHVFYVNQIPMTCFCYSIMPHCNIPCCSVLVQCIVCYEETIHLWFFSNLWIILFKQQSLLRTHFTCSTTYDRKSHSPKNYHILQSTVYITAIPKWDVNFTCNTGTEAVSWHRLYTEDPLCAK